MGEKDGRNEQQESKDPRARSTEHDSSVTACQRARVVEEGGSVSEETDGRDHVKHY